ncbi:Uu.00g084190.m01.CDS01 [Anthostomella pinea]|uniref:Uu.00g084190.m01.CDS01 n=1 Tax=Anthostomella pinea TaxID=933095 RepID=A0AAI8YJT6_9PEZI|nr:Uu.00g084190.m01.CDS01 [Anthostomella pinea]
MSVGHHKRVEILGDEASGFHYVCPFCGVSNQYHREGSVYGHIIDHHPEYRESPQLLDDVNRHYEPMNLRCPQNNCPYAAHGNRNLQGHIKRQHLLRAQDVASRSSKAASEPELKKKATNRVARPEGMSALGTQDASVAAPPNTRSALQDEVKGGNGSAPWVTSVRSHDHESSDADDYDDDDDDDNGDADDDGEDDGDDNAGTESVGQAKEENETAITDHRTIAPLHELPKQDGPKPVLPGRTKIRCAICAEKRPNAAPVERSLTWLHLHVFSEHREMYAAWRKDNSQPKPRFYPRNVKRHILVYHDQEVLEEWLSRFEGKPPGDPAPLLSVTQHLQLRQFFETRVSRHAAKRGMKMPMDTCDEIVQVSRDVCQELLDHSCGTMSLDERVQITAGLLRFWTRTAAAAILERDDSWEAEYTAAMDKFWKHIEIDYEFTEGEALLRNEVPLPPNDWAHTDMFLLGMAYTKGLGLGEMKSRLFRHISEHRVANIGAFLYAAIDDINRRLSKDQLADLMEHGGNVGEIQNVPTGMAFPPCKPSERQEERL